MKSEKKVEPNAGGEPNAGEPNAGCRKADILEDSPGGLELNDDRRLSTSITSEADLFSDFSLRFITVLSNNCSDDFISCSCRDCCTLSSSCVNLISFSSLAIKGGIPTPCSKLGDSVCVCMRAIKYS